MQNYYAARKWERLPQSDCPAYSPVREAKTGIPSVSPAYRGIKMEWLWSERPLIIPVIPLGRGWGEFQMTGVRIHFSNSCKNDKRNSNLFFNNKQCKNVKRNSNPFFKVMRKRKTKTEIQIRFSKLSENENKKAKLKSVFQCHAKTKNVNGIWMPFSHAIEKRLALRYTHF